MQQIKIDFDNPGFPQRLDVVENDAQSRFFKAVLYKDGKAYTAPDGATYSIMYRGFGPQNEGWYDTISDGAGKRAACSVSGNVVTCEIARQALRVPGHVSVMLCVTRSNGYMLHGWPIDCNCRNDSYTNGTSVESFFYITQVTNADWNSAIQAWEELKNMIDPTLSLSGKAADAAKVGEAVNAEAERAKAAEEENAQGIGQLKEDLGDIAYGFSVIHTQTKTEDFGVKLLKGKKYSISILGNVGKSFYLSENTAYASSNAVQLVNNVTVDVNEYIFEADKNYFSARLYQQTNTDCSIEIKEVPQKKASREILSPSTLVTGELYGNTDSIVDSTLSVSTPIYNEKAIYLVSFPSTIKAKYNLKEKESADNRVTVETSSPFLVKNDSEFRVTFSRTDGKAISKASPWFSDSIRIYKMHPLEDYDITVAQSGTQYEDSAAIVIDDSNATYILSAVFGAYHSVKALIYPGEYKLNDLYSVTDKCKAVLPFCNYNINGGSKERRLIMVEGLFAGSPQVEKSVNFIVTKALHNNFVSGINNFVIGGNYNYGEKIQRLSTSVNIKNINIIGYKYDKPVTYVDATRCLSAYMESVNVRSWNEHLTDYAPFDETPNTECCGIRVGRGSNYGIGNALKHLNVWYCGKGIACNGEHFVFEDVKTHHCYIGWYFGDKETVGNFEHSNVMIGCSIEACYRMMILSKQGETVEQDFVKNSSNNKFRSTLDIIGMSVENTWSIPINERTTDTGDTSKTLPILEILRGAYRGKMDIELGSNPFADGSGKKFLWIAWAANGVNTSNYIDFSAINN